MVPGTIVGDRERVGVGSVKLLFLNNKIKKLNILMVIARKLTHK